MKRLQLTLLFLSLGTSLIFSQGTAKVDSLLMVLNNGNLCDEDEITALLDLSYYHSDISSSLAYAKKGLGLAEKKPFPVLQAEAWEEISSLEFELGNNSSSLNASFNALKIYDSLQLRDRSAASFIQLANNFMSNQNYTDAIKYLEKAIKIYTEIDDQLRRNYAVINLGEMYRLLGDIKEAEYHFKQVLQNNKKLNDTVSEAYAKGNLGMIYRQQNVLESAVPNLERAIYLLEAYNDTYALPTFLAELGYAQEQLNNDAKAKELFIYALQLAKKENLKEQIRDINQKLSLFYEARGYLKEALLHQREFQIYQDSIVNKANIQKIERLKAGFVIDQRETEIQLLNTLNSTQKRTLWILGFTAFCILCFAYFLWLNRRKIKAINKTLLIQKLQISEREKEKELLLQELNHRVKNNLQMVASLLSLQGNQLEGHPAKQALLEGKNRVEALTLVHQQLYQDGSQSKINLKIYVEELVLGLFHSYNTDFEPKIDIAETSIAVDTAIPLVLIINEMVVNALKYAFETVANPVLIVKIEQNNAALEVKIIDNGIGFKPKSTGSKQSFGLKLIHSLVKQLNGTLEKKQSQGTYWYLKIPVAPTHIKNSQSSSLEHIEAEKTWYRKRRKKRSQNLKSNTY